jgi:lipopolysaccharide export LptBFGC system permease protein LptF
MRLFPLVAGANLSATELVQLMGWIAIPLTSWALPAASVFSLVLLFSGLARQGEHTALAACGASNRRLALAPLCFSFAVSAAAGANALYGEPWAYEALHQGMVSSIGRAWWSQWRPGIMTNPTPGLTLFMARREGNRLYELFIDDRRTSPTTQLFAASADLADPNTTWPPRLTLHQGAWHRHLPNGWVARARFETFTLSLTDVTAELPQLGLVPPAFRRFPKDLWRASQEEKTLSADSPGGGPEGVLHRRLALAPGSWALAWLGLWLALRWRLTSTPWAVALGSVTVLGYHLVGRLGELAVLNKWLSPAGGAWLPPSIMVGLLLLSWLTPPLAGRLFRR